MITTENIHSQTFHRFFDCWLGELNTNLGQLVSAANQHHDDDNIEDDSILRQLIDKSVGHYQVYFNTKSDTAKRDVISMFSPTWLSSLENAFLWIAGWRPTTAIHLLFSKSGIQLEARLLIPVLTGEDLADLSLNQMNRVDELQRKTIREERVISEKMATLQESAADAPLVELSNAISELMRNENDDGGKDSDQRLESELDLKKDELKKLLQMADVLRMETLKSVVEILTPIQAVSFLIAAAELHLRVHDWGKKLDTT